MARKKGRKDVKADAAPSGSASLFICPSCGSLASSGAKSCPKCGATFDESDEMELALVEEATQPGKDESDGFWYKERASLFLCPACGSLATTDAKKCPSCGVEFEEEEAVEMPLVPAEPEAASQPKDADGFWYKERASLFLCPECGSLASSGAASCPKCGAKFAEEAAVEMPLDEAVEPVGSSEAKGGADGFWYKDEASLFLCPSCGSLAASTAKRCPSCGVEFGEEEAVEMPLVEQTVDGKVGGAEEAGKKGDADGFWYKDRKGVLICPGCGSLNPEGDARCHKCGKVIDTKESVEMPIVQKGADEGELSGEPAELFLCPDCGAFMSERADKCSICGASFGGEDAEKAETASAETSPAVAPVNAPEMPRCKGCGGPLPSSGADCPACRSKLRQCASCGEGFEGQGELCATCAALEEAIGMGSLVPDVKVEPALAAPNPSAAPRPKVDVHEPSRPVVPPSVVAPAPAPAAQRPSAKGAPSCESCGAPVREGESLCLDCRIGKLAAKLDGRSHEAPASDRREKRRGISRDFIQRWSGMGAPGQPPEASDEGKAAPGSDFGRSARDSVAVAPPAEPEPSSADEWFQRGARLMGEDRLDEAMVCFDKAAEMSPDREVDYRAKALALLSKMDETGAGAEEDLISKDMENLDARLWFIEESLKNNPRDDRLWQEKGDLLMRRGQSAEATKCFQEAIRLSYERISELESSATAPVPSGPVGRGRGSGAAQVRGSLGLTSGDGGRTNGRTNGLVNGRGHVNGLAGGIGRTNGGGRTNGLTNGRGRTNGRINGLVNGRGRTNGKVNGLVNGRGRTNGRVNGLVNGRGRTNGRLNGLGRTNGLVNGRGLINGTGRVNGLVNGLGVSGGLTNGFGLVNGSGLVNGVGLINGSGFVNGNAGAVRHARREEAGRWNWIAFVLALAVFAMMFSPMLDLGGTRGSALAVDGDFADWETVAGYRNAVILDPSNPDVRIDTVKLGYEPPKLFVYASVGGRALAGRNEPGLNTTASLYAFVDGDRDAGTGYSIGGLGADFLLDVTGWRGDREGATLKTFDPSKNQTDWLGFDSGAAASAAVSTSEIEAEAFLPVNITSPLVLVCTSDGAGYSGSAEAPVSPGLPVVKAFVRGPSVPTMTSAGAAVLQRITLHSSGGAAQVTGLVLEGVGSAPLASSVSSISIESAGAGSAALEFTGARDGNLVTITFGSPIALGNNQLVNLTISGDVGAGTAAPFTTGLELERVLRSDAGDSRVSRLASSAISVGVWDSVVVDGSFADWENVAMTADAVGDSTSTLGGGFVANRNVDIVSTAMLDTGDFFAEVTGRILGGMDFPSYAIRRGTVPPPDWNTSDDDRDGVPNRDDPMPDDFDNDGANDSTEGGDADGDGAVEWPHGPDFWMNTTIPAGFPSSYAGANRSVYVGPVSEREMRGEDSLILWIDRDGDSMTGAPVAGGLGADFAAIVTGRGGTATASSIASYDPSQGAVPWLDLGEALAVASDFGKLEGRLPAWALGTESIVSIELRDSEGCSDAGDDPIELDAMAAGTRSPAGDNVVVNEVVARPSNAEWVELCNPTNSAIAIGGWRLTTALGGVIATIPAGTMVGAFGSGSEYYVVDLSSAVNNIPDPGTQVVLQRPRNLGRWTTIDILYYGATADYQSTARFKNATFGMPTDTDAATGDTYVSNLASRAAPNDRRRPVVAVDKVGDRTSAQPGMTVVYTIYYNNTGDADARHVWVNDTLPAGMTYVSSSQPYASVSGQTYGWYFSGVAPGAHSFTITAQVDTSTPVGTALTNTASLTYTDQLSRPIGSSSDSWLVTVAAPAPFIAVKKVASAPTASPGETITYTIWYNNTGLGTASHVWVNDTLPVGMSYASAAPSPGSVVGQTQYWHFANVAPGAYSISLHATVGAGVAPGTVLTNTAICNYKNLGGSSLPASSSQATVTVAAASARLVINEISSLPNPEWIEIANPTGVSVNIGGWTIFSSFANPIYTFPAGTIIGPWGSGTEYLVAQMTQSNRLPNDGATVTLRNSAFAVVDSTTYPAMVSGQTWSRFKHEDTGKPVDTNTAADFYISNNAWIVPEGPTRNAPNDRHRPVIEVEKGASVAEAEPGDAIIYTIWYNNTGDGNAKRVWVNDTLPVGTTYVSATPAPSSVSGQLVSWYFPTVTKETTNSITVSVLISGEPADGTVLSNVVDLTYRDQLLRPMAASRAWANVTARKPTIVVEKVADVAVAQPGETITYTIFYNNTGSRSAAHLWINDTLPQHVTFQSSSVVPTTVSGPTYGWHFTNVAPGAHSLTITVQVNATAPSGIITNLATLNYTTSNSKPLAGSSDSASVLVVVPELGHEHFAVALVLLLGLAYRTRRRRDAI